MKNNIGQGTIEYLVIIAVIVVIGLVVAAMSTNFLGDSQQINNANANIKGQIGTGGISVIETIADSQGNAFITLKNNSGENLTVTRISTANADNAYDKQMLNLTQNTFYITDINTYCPCTTGQTKNTCTFYITTTDKYGNTQTETLTNVTVNCITEATPRDPTKIVGLGTGTLADPFIINNCNELQEIQNDLDGNYALGADINCYETYSWNYDPAYQEGGAYRGFIPIGTFTGSLNGRKHKVTNLFIDTDLSDAGLFSILTGSITNLELDESEFYGGAHNLGCFAGINSGDINFVYGNCFVYGTEVTGGIAGTNSGTISNSHIANMYVNFENTGFISESLYLGGVAGLNSGTIDSCYSTANIEICGEVYRGGIAGNNMGGKISNCFSVGKINYSEQYNQGGITGVSTDGTFTNNYWDIGLTDQPNCDPSIDCTGYSTYSQAALYYSASGIPFATLYWSTSIWQANNSNYPTLK